MNLAEAPVSSSSSGKNSGKKLGWVIRTLFALIVAGTFLVAAGIGTIYYHFSKGLPKIITVEDYRPLVVTRILGGGGKEDQLLGEFFKEKRYVIPYDRMPKVLIQAFISAEDDQFFEHQGVNLSSIIRASIANFRAGHVVQGGSTITQQVAKSLLLTSERSFVRKIKELILAGRIESNLKKEQILYLYLNQIYLGHGAYGVEAASRTYYRKSAKDLSIAEAAVLAGLPQAPGKYSPHLNPKRAKERQLYVLRRMRENKFITSEQMQEAAGEPLKVYTDEDVNAKYSAYLTEFLRKKLVEKYGEKTVYEDGLIVAVPTTAALIEQARKSLQEGLRSIDKRVGYRGPIQKLKTPAEVEEFLTDQRTKLILNKVGYEILLPDGRMDGVAAMKTAGLTSDAQLLKEGELQMAIVTSVDDRKKVASVMIGALKADMPMESMRWARAAKDEKNPGASRPEPSVPSQVVAKGDVVKVKIVEVKGENVRVALDQDAIVQGGIFSIDAQTGYVLAMEGGYDFDSSEFNRVTQAERQPGSSFKPFVYALALEKGFTPASILVDSPLVFDEGEAGKWKPTNFEERFKGDITFRQALIKSMNIPTLKIAQAIQVPVILEYAKRLGLEGKLPSDFTVSLGSGGLSLYNLTKTYALFPRLGHRVTPIFISSVKDREGRLLEEQKPQIAGPLPSLQQLAEAAPIPKALPTQAAGYLGSDRARVGFPQLPMESDPELLMDPRVAYVMTHLMKEVVNYGTGHDAKTLGRSAAGKTGTTNEFVDAWFMGFTPHVVTGVWVGFDNLKPLGPGETGAKAALPIWLSFMKEAVKEYPDTDFTIPPGVVFATIDPNTGHLVPPNASGAIKEAFVEGTEPLSTDNGPTSLHQTESEFLKEDIE